MPTLRELARFIDQRAPERLAEPWDNVGLQLGDPSMAVAGVLATLECDRDTVAEAKAKGCNAIVSHHPLIFKPVKSIVADGYQSGTIAAILGAGMGFICAHTNLDKADWGTNRVLADMLGVRDVRFLHPEAPAKLQKLAVFVPEGSESTVIDAIDAAGGGVIGRYRKCTFRAKGIGGFQGDESTNPTIGQPGVYEETPEWRLETIAPAAIMPKVVAAMIAAHPYEEVAYDVYDLARSGDVSYGLGYVGTLDVPPGQEPTLADFARRAGETFRTDFTLAVGDRAKRIRTVALSSGSGGHSVLSLPGDVADVLVTGELNYHAATEARHKGMAVVCLGHFASETFVAEAIAKAVSTGFPGLKAAASASSSDPFWRP